MRPTVRCPAYTATTYTPTIGSQLRPALAVLAFGLRRLRAGARPFRLRFREAQSRSVSSRQRKASCDLHGLVEIFRSAGKVGLAQEHLASNPILWYPRT